jgi:hypothetical protein
MRKMMEAGATQRAASSLLLTARLFGIVDEKSSTLHVLFSICVSIFALVLGSRVVLLGLDDLGTTTDTPTLALVSLLYKVRENKSFIFYFKFLQISSTLKRNKLKLTN